MPVGSRCAHYGVVAAYGSAERDRDDSKYANRSKVDFALPRGPEIILARGLVGFLDDLLLCNPKRTSKDFLRHRVGRCKAP